MLYLTHNPRIPTDQTPWNKGKLTGQKPPLKIREIWAIRIRLQLSNRVRDLALFNLAIDSKLRYADTGLKWMHGSNRQTLERRHS